jgi:hypothetical protein
MAIKIIKEQDVYLTNGEFHRLKHEYDLTFSFYSGPVPTFEDWVREKKQADQNKEPSNG